MGLHLLLVWLASLLLSTNVMGEPPHGSFMGFGDMSMPHTDLARALSTERLLFKAKFFWIGVLTSNQCCLA